MNNGKLEITATVYRCWNGSTNKNNSTTIAYLSAI